MPPYVPLVFQKDGEQRTATNAVEATELRFDGWLLIGVSPNLPGLPFEDQIAALTARVLVLESGGSPSQPVFSISPTTGHVLAAMPNGTVVDLNGQGAYESAVERGFVGTEDAWVLSLKGSAGAPLPSGGFLSPTVTNDYLTVQIQSNWGRNADGTHFFNAAGASPTLAAILGLLDNGSLGLRQIGDPDRTGGTVTTERGTWMATTTYIRGDIVAHVPTCSRWSCTVGNLNSIPSLTNTNWVHVGLWAIQSATDPGGGIGWFSPGSGGGTSGGVDGGSP